MGRSDKSLPSQRRWAWLLIVAVCALLFFVMVAGTVGGLALYKGYARGLPEVESLENYRPSLVTKVFAADGRLLREFFVEKRYLVSLSEVPLHLRQATLAIEDSRFYRHRGVDPVGILRAAWANLRAGEVVQGGSTITQQVAKTLFLNPEKTLVRKVREAILALRIEGRFSKDRILNLYLNLVYYGHGAYGVEAAARLYFGKSIGALTLAEAALLAGLPRAPARYSPYVSPRRALRRRAQVLRRMRGEGFITPAEEAGARREPLRLAGRDPQPSEAPYAVEHVRRYLEKRYGATLLYRGGLRVYTTIDLDAQRAAIRALRRGLEALDRRRGYRGPLGRVAFGWGRAVSWEQVERVVGKREEWPEIRSGRWRVGVVTAVGRARADVALRRGRGRISITSAAWARRPEPSRDGLYARLRDLREVLAPGMVILVKPRKGEREVLGGLSLDLAQPLEVQGALVSLDPETGAIRAMVGGYEFSRSQFNRAVQAVRPPGSAFKPITYSTALENGFTPSSLIVDSPVIYEETLAGLKRSWKPTNFEERFYGPTTLRDALVHSRNVATVKLFRDLGVRKVVARARRLGITTPLAEDLSLALGSSGVTLLELAGAYAVFAAQGVRAEPYIIQRVEDAQGRVLEKGWVRREKVIPAPEAYVLTSLLRDVIRSGTGQRARELGRPAAGKTGTTNEFEDAWFVGFTPHQLAAVWVGLDERGSLGKNETGARAALPIWLEYMKATHAALPVQDFPVPPGVTFVRIDPKTGRRVGPGAPGGLGVAFVKGTEPEEARPEPVPSPGDFFRQDLQGAGG
ncbi:MAG: penicillin-binding protein 1A [Nitrospinota bacterium]